MKYLFIYLVLINLIAIIITCYDKYCAVKNKWRVKERTLFTISVLGGSIGMYLTMQTIRHKTKHLKFMLGIPAIFIVEIVIAILLVIHYAG